MSETATNEAQGLQSSQADAERSLTTEHDPKVAKLLDENAKRRLAQRALEERIKELEGALSARELAAKQGEQKRLEEQAQWETLAKQRAQELEGASAALEEYKRSAHQHLIKSHARSLLASSGITSAEQQDLLLPGILAKVEASVGDGFAIEGDFSSAIESARELLGMKANKVPAALNTSSLLSGQLPSKGVDSKSTNPLDELRAGIVSALRGG